MVGGIASLKGPLHGGANEAVAHMLNEVGSPDKAEEFILNRIKNKELILVISTMALTLQQALDNFDTSDKVSAAQFDEYLLDEWGMILNQYKKSK